MVSGYVGKQQTIKNQKYTVPKKTSIAAKHFDPIIDAMHEVFKTGTGKSSQIQGLEICGKTGTVENSIKIIDGVKTQAPDHSILVAFAPKENPKIAIAVFVENGGYGSTIAAPISSLIIEKYLKGKISKPWVEKRIKALSLQEVYDKQKSKEIAPRTK